MGWPILCLKGHMTQLERAYLLKVCEVNHDYEVNQEGQDGLKSLN